MADLGPWALGDTLRGFIQTVDANGQDTDADAAPTFRIYGPSGYLGVQGTSSFFESGSVTGATNAAPIVITSTAHGLTTGQRVTISGVLGNTAANGTFTIIRIDANTFSLNGTTGNGAYTSGGTWHTSGWYKYEPAIAGGSGFETGKSYEGRVQGVIGGTAVVDIDTFWVV